MKLLLSMLLLCINIAIKINVVSESFDFMTMSTDSIELINNSLSVLVLIDIDQMLSIFYSNWITNYFNQVTLLSNFMLVKSTAKIETTLYTLTIYFGTFMSYFCIINYNVGNEIKLMADEA